MTPKFPPSGPAPSPFSPSAPPMTPGWTRERNEPRPVDPNAAPGQAPVYRPGTPTK